MSICFFEFFLNKVFLLQRNVNIESKDRKTHPTHSHITLSSKFWYQLLTLVLSILRKLDIINKLLCDNKNNAKNENRDNINTSISWFIH